MNMCIITNTDAFLTIAHLLCVLNTQTKEVGYIAQAGNLFETAVEQS